MKQKLRWGIMGTGAIARTFAAALTRSETGALAAVGSRTQRAADAFGDALSIARRHGSYQALIEDEEVDVIYIATPHPVHAEWAIKAAEAGKHLLVEKPLGVNHAEAMAIVEAARCNDVFLMEGYMYRCHPQTARLIELLRERAIGDVRVIQATFSFHWPIPFDGNSRLLSNELMGGGILDVGGYCTSMARLIAGAAVGLPIVEPVEVSGAAHLGETGVDEWAVATMKFAGGIVAQLAAGVQVEQENVVRVYGSEGQITVPDPWFGGRDGKTTKLLITRRVEAQREVVVETPQPLYALEADVVARDLKDRQASAPAMSWDDSLGNMATLDAWRKAVGLTYEAEKTQALVPTVTRRPLRVRADSMMRYMRINGVAKEISRLVMGCDNQMTFPHASIMFDDFFERGGNAFDTAHQYWGGLQEKFLGAWLRNRKLRDEVVIIGKGAHTPYCRPEYVGEQLMITLDRLGVESLDVYLLHRDNADVPVGEFVDALNEQHRAGRIGVFGGSNWSIERVDAANAYARSKGLKGFGVVSNNFSLARMVDPVWPGCISSSDAESRTWHTRTQMPLLAWSSQARGFFLPGRARPDDFSDPELVRSWYSADNFRRLERVMQLAEKRRVLPINIALAYVLSQPFPTLGLIGPRVLSETRTSLGALAVDLSPAELRWLNLEQDEPVGGSKVSVQIAPGATRATPAGNAHSPALLD